MVLMQVAAWKHCKALAGTPAVNDQRLAPFAQHSAAGFRLPPIQRGLMFISSDTLIGSSFEENCTLTLPVILSLCERG